MHARLLPAIAVLLTLSVSAFAAKIELVAGGGIRESNAPAKECVLREPFGTEFLPDGTLAIIEMVSGNRLLRVDKAGVMKLIGGTGVKGFSGDGGDARKAQMNGVHNIAVAPNGDIFLSDAWNYRVRRINAQTGIITTFAGTGKKGFSGDGGPAVKADFGTVIQVALDPAAKHLYVADIDNKRIRRIELVTGIVETVAGNGKGGKPEDGAVAKQSPLSDPRAVVAAPDASLYILERGGHALRFVDATGKIRTVAGTGKAGLSGDDGPALDATMNGPKHLCLDRDGTVIIADAETNTIRRYDPKSGKITRVAGTGKKGDSGLGGDPLACELARPHGVTVSPDGILYITDSYNNRVLRIVP
jgi:DNA-binding beta-propeller fold protein YncE